MNGEVGYFCSGGGTASSSSSGGICLANGYTCYGVASECCSGICVPYTFPGAPPNTGVCN